MDKTNIKKRSQILEVWQRLKLNKMAMAGLIVFSLLILLSIVAPFIVDYDTDVIGQNTAIRLQWPSKEHIFGTDEYGRDLFARVIYGSRISLYVGIFSVVISVFFGTLIGGTAGYYGGKYDYIVMRFMDILLALPSILLAITIASSLGSSMVNLIIAIAIADIAVFARVVRGSVIMVKDQEYVESAKVIGDRDYSIIMRYVLPNCFAPLLVQMTFRIAGSILAIAGLSFIGLGIAPPTPEWGSMLAGARAYYRDYSYLATFPGVFIMLTILSLNLLGDGLRDALDPKLK